MWKIYKITIGLEKCVVPETEVLGNYFGGKRSLWVAPCDDRNLFWILFILTKFWLYLHISSRFSSKRNSVWCFNQPEKCNFNPNLVKINQIQDLFLCGPAMRLLTKIDILFYEIEKKKTVSLIFVVLFKKFCLEFLNKKIMKNLL